MVLQTLCSQGTELPCPPAWVRSYQAPSSRAMGLVSRHPQDRETGENALRLLHFFKTVGWKYPTGVSVEDRIAQLSTSTQDEKPKERHGRAHPHNYAAIFQVSQL